MNLLLSILKAPLHVLNFLVTGGDFGKRIPRAQMMRYYKSPQWNAKRIEAFRIHGRACKVCGGTSDLQVHHLRYTKGGRPIFGRENPRTDLRILCKDHHPKGKYAKDSIGRDRKAYWWYKRFLKKKQ